MIPLANRPMIYYALENFARAGISEVGVVLGPKGDTVREAIGDGRSFGLRVSFLEQGEPKGLAHAVSIAREYLRDEVFVMHLGDNFIQDGLEPFVAAFQESHPSAVIGAVEVQNPSYFGVVDLDNDGRVRGIAEKPSRPKSRWAVTGVYLFTKLIHEVIADLPPSDRGELEITDAIEALRRQAGDVRAVKLQGWWMDAGSPTDLLAVNDHLLSERAATSETTLVTPGMEGAEGSYLATSATLRGPVVIGRGVRVEGDSVIGPCVSVGEGCVIRDASLSRSMVFDRCEISGPIQIDQSIMGSRSKIKTDGHMVRLDSTILADDSVVRVGRERDPG